MYRNISQSYNFNTASENGGTKRMSRSPQGMILSDISIFERLCLPLLSIKTDFCWLSMIPLLFGTCI